MKSSMYDLELALTSVHRDLDGALVLLQLARANHTEAQMFPLVQKEVIPKLVYALASIPYMDVDTTGETDRKQVEG